MMDPVQIIQCGHNRLFLDDISKSKVQGYASFSPSISSLRSNYNRSPNYLGIIPGGQSFEIPQSNISKQGGINWQPSLQSSTTLILVAGDARGNGTGGSVLYTVSTGAAFDKSCLNENSPSSTPGNPAGSYPTASGGGGGGHVRLNVGATIAAILGSVTVLVICAIILWRWRRKLNRWQGLRAVLLDRVDDDDDDDGEEQWKKARKQPQVQEPLHHYSPEPFRFSHQLPGSDDERTALMYSEHEDRRFMSPSNSLDGALSPRSSSAGTNSQGGIYQAISGGLTSSGESSGRRKGLPRTPALALVNVIQHDDAVPPLSPLKELIALTTVELPPAYTALKRLQTRQAGAVSSSSGRGGSYEMGGSSGGSEIVRMDRRDDQRFRTFSRQFSYCTAQIISIM
ncbi:hypothetical protein CPB83DRAFT_616692 [Crepidotus variabilis]|uniref:Uncharacterized protein n=1 Tax=Crepidotus variabilis TaxID=179855 RepID=A0A9P6JL50_9AGAR|nr:hypothetical protein CPB83DRAFT_616692 [Crepidotus variabilis]